MGLKFSFSGPVFIYFFQFRSYKVYNKKAMDEQDEDARDALLQKFAEHIWKIEGSGECKNRMRCILNAEDMQRIWPDFRNYVDNSWKIPDLGKTKKKIKHGREKGTCFFFPWI